MKNKFFGLMLMGMSISGSAWAQQPGTLDESFNGKGIKEISFSQNTSSDSVVATVLQPDGKLLVALVDNAGAGNAPTANAVVIRLKSNGALDLSFGLGGKVNVSHTVKNNFHPNAMALQEDGKIVLAGHTNNLAKPCNLCIVRLNADGSKDDTFGETAGPKKTGYRGISTSQGYTFRTVQVHNQTGTVLAAASTENTANIGNFIFTATDQYGAIVTNYGGNTNGIVSLDFGTPGPTAYDDIVRTSAIDQSTGVWYIAGTTRVGGNSTVRSAIVGIDAATGIYKTNYKGNGKVILPLAPGTNYNDCRAMCFAPDNHSILLAGSPDAGASKMMVYKLDMKMKADSSFSSDGIELYSIPNTTDCKAYSIAAETGNKVLLGGYAQVSTVGPVPAYIKFNSSTGEVIHAFGTDGAKIFTGKTTDFINALLYSPAMEKFISAGSFSINASGDVVVKRLEANGDADNSYGTNSEVICYAEDGVTSIKDVWPRSDGKLWACGNVSNTYGAVALLNRDGSFDASFSNTLGNDPGVQYVSSFLPLPPLNTNPLPNAQAHALAETGDGKLLIAGTYQQYGNSDVTMYVLKLKNNNGTWIRDTDFGTNGYSIVPLGIGYDYLHDIIVQPDGKILLFGYVYYNSTYYAAVTRLKSNGAVDISDFASASPIQGTYMIPLTTVSNPVATPLHLTFVLQDDSKIVCTAPAKNALGASVFLAHRILPNGTADAVFNANATNALTLANAESETILLKKNGSIVLGGTQTNTTKNYAMAQLKTDGKIDTDFNNTGIVSFSRGYEPEVILQLNEQSDHSIVATAIASIIEGNYLIMDIRVSAKGELDKTFYGEGLIPIAKGFPETSLMLDGSLFIFGERNATEETAVGIMMKVKLGTGPVLKTTNLVLPNLTVQYGDKPFKLQPITNSSAKVYYSVVQGDCAKVNPLTNEVIITCATVDSGEDVIIRAFQPPVAGYTTDTAYSIIKVIKATPRILFTNEGGELGDTIKILAISSSGTTPVFTQLDGTAYVQFLTANTVKLIGEGSSTVSATFPATQNYEQATAVALISGYTESLPPDANADEAQLIFGTEVNISIDILGNDEAFTGVIVPTATDLDPSTPGRDTVFVSPSLGLFELDSTGIVTYTPFSGFIGSGDITYTIRDSKGLKSLPGAIHVAVIPKVDPPALKATEMVTPNNDGLNEAFVIGFVNLDKENKLKIFDRNGQELFAKDNYQNDWTGILPNGSAVENGIYYYVFIEGAAEDQRELKGAVEIRR